MKKERIYMKLAGTFQWIKRKVKVVVEKVALHTKKERVEMLRWEQLIGFAVVALVLWIVVANSSVASTAARDIIEAVAGAIDRLISQISTFS